MNHAEYLLSCLSEECAEIAQRASKAQRFGLSEIQPGQGLTNVQRLVGELHDLMGVVQLMEDEGILKVGRGLEAVAAKKEKLRRFMEYSRQCGTLQP